VVASPHPGCIHHQSPLREVVEFEIPSFEDATRLYMRLALDWFTWIEARDGLRFVVVMLAPQTDDLAALLRAVQAWGRGHRVDAIPFELDARRYVLDACERPAASVAA
jgi:hypothetical protein